MSILDIVLVIELVLLAAIAIVLLVALLQRNRQNRQVYPCTGGTCLYTPNPYLPVGTYPGLYGSGSTTFAQMPEMTSGQFPYDQMPVGKASGQMPAGPASDGRMPSGRTAFSETGIASVSLHLCTLLFACACRRINACLFVDI